MKKQRATLLLVVVGRNEKELSFQDRLAGKWSCVAKKLDYMTGKTKNGFTLSKN